jgi:hypothetical protein
MAAKATIGESKSKSKDRERILNAWVTNQTNESGRKKSQMQT